LRNNVIPKDLIYFEQLFDYEDIQKSKMLAIQKESYVEREVEPGIHIKVGS